MDVLPFGRRIEEILLIFEVVSFFCIQVILILLLEVVNKSHPACLKMSLLYG